MGHLAFILWKHLKCFSFRFDGMVLRGWSRLYFVSTSFGVFRNLRSKVIIPLKECVPPLPPPVREQSQKVAKRWGEKKDCQGEAHDGGSRGGASISLAVVKDLNKIMCAYNITCYYIYISVFFVSTVFSRIYIHESYNAHEARRTFGTKNTIRLHHLGNLTLVNVS